MESNTDSLLCFQRQLSACESCSADWLRCKMMLTKNPCRQKAGFITWNCSCTEANEGFQVSYWSFLEADSQCSCKSSLSPEDGCVDDAAHTHEHTPPASTLTYISTPACVIYHPLLRVQSHTASHRQRQKSVIFVWIWVYKACRSLQPLQRFVTRLGSITVI